MTCEGLGMTAGSCSATRTMTSGSSSCPPRNEAYPCSVCGVAAMKRLGSKSWCVRTSSAPSRPMVGRSAGVAGRITFPRTTRGETPSAVRSADTRRRHSARSLITCGVRGDRPLPPCKVRKLYGRAALCDRLLRQRTGHTPRSRVVDVHVGSEPRAHALHETPGHDEIHSTMSAAARAFALFAPPRMLELGLVAVDRGPLIVFAAPLHIDARRVILE